LYKGLEHFAQVEGIDYSETFSPIVRLASLRLFSMVGATEDLDLYQMDNDTVFLDGLLLKTFLGGFTWLSVSR